MNLVLFTWPNTLSVYLSVSSGNFALDLLFSGIYLFFLIFDSIPKQVQHCGRDRTYEFNQLHHTKCNTPHDRVKW